MNNIITANFYPGKCPGMPVCSYATGPETGPDPEQSDLN